jgi:hypothetical protein
MYTKGDRIKISSSNDNENYVDFKNDILVVTHASRGGRGYDESMYPQKLMSFEMEGGEDFPFSLYEWEIEFA